MLYVGVHAHGGTSWTTVVDEQGKVLKRREICSFHKGRTRTSCALSPTDEGDAGGQLQLATHI